MKFYKRMMLLILVVSVFILGCENGNEINYENTLDTRSNNTDLPNPFINIEEFQNNNLTPYVEPNTATDSLNLVAGNLRNTASKTESLADGVKTVNEDSALGISGLSEIQSSIEGVSEVQLQTADVLSRMANIIDSVPKVEDQNLKAREDGNPQHIFTSINNSAKKSQPIWSWEFEDCSVGSSYEFTKGDYATVKVAIAKSDFISSDGSGVDLESLIMPPMVVLSPDNVQIAELIFDRIPWNNEYPYYTVATYTASAEIGLIDAGNVGNYKVTLQSSNEGCEEILNQIDYMNIVDGVSLIGWFVE
tara:strand:+ start:409 stop:1323 length:915 start_codon:yes stop_codon:yes gene_type:complete